MHMCIYACVTAVKPKRLQSRIFQRKNNKPICPETVTIISSLLMGNEAKKESDIVVHVQLGSRGLLLQWKLKLHTPL